MPVSSEPERGKTLTSFAPKDTTPGVQHERAWQKRLYREREDLAAAEEQVLSGQNVPFSERRHEKPQIQRMPDEGGSRHGEVAGKAALHA